MSIHADTADRYVELSLESALLRVADHVGVFYRDDCVRVDVIYRKEDTRIAQLGPREQITVRLTLATLGEPIYAN